MESSSELEELRSYWQFENVCQFFMIFYPAFGLENFETDDFEIALIDQNENLITFYILKLVNFLPFGRSLKQDDWVTPTLDAIFQVGQDLPLPKRKPETFFEQSLFHQVVCIQCLTDLQFKYSTEQLRNALDDEENSQDWRVKPIGKDKKGNTYYIFDDNRLYVKKPELPITKRPSVRKFKGSEPDVPSAEQSDKTWELLCITLQDWESFPATFKGSRNADEKDLYDTLVEDVLPQVTADLEAKEKKKQKILELAAMKPKRSNRLMEREADLKKKEQIRLNELKARALDEATKVPEIALPEEKPLVITQSRELRAKRRDLKMKGMSEELAELEKACGAKPSKSTPLPKEVSEPEKWYFSCVCGKEGPNFDDGSKQVQCETCLVWQHTACVKYLSPSGRPVRDFDRLPFFCTKCKVIPPDSKEILAALVDLDHPKKKKKHLKIRISLKRNSSQDHDGLSDTPEGSVSSCVPSPTASQGELSIKFPTDLQKSSSPTVSTLEKGNLDPHEPEVPAEFSDDKDASSLSGLSSPLTQTLDHPITEGQSSPQAIASLPFDDFKLSTAQPNISPLMELASLASAGPGASKTSSNALSSTPNSPELLPNGKRSICKAEQAWIASSPSKKARHLNQ